ncbi:hypothetical protein GCM10010439_68030 [Actinocorallia aurantiaca]|uniref:Tachylectin n=2 Tax=Actinocorallia aurantiaca TaxID=46204 RepID=A0ABP6HAW9_9ACTN
MRLPALAKSMRVTAVNAFRPKDVWVFTADTRSGMITAAKPKAFHWNGVKWRRFTLPRRGQVLEVAGRSRDFWTTVDSGGMSASGWNGLLRWKNGRWTVAKSLPRPMDGSYPHTGLTVLARDDVRVFTRQERQKPTRAWRYDGRTWKSKGFGRFLTAFEVLPGGRMWAADTTGGEDESFLYRYDGKRWKRQAVPSSLGCPKDHCSRLIWFIEATSEKDLVVGYGDRLLKWNGAARSLFARGPLGGPVSDGAGGFWSVETDGIDLTWDGLVRVAPTGRLTTHPYRGPAKGISLHGLAVAPKGPVFVYGSAKSSTGRRFHLWRVSP